MKTFLFFLLLTATVSAQSFTDGVHSADRPAWMNTSRYSNFTYFDYCPDDQPPTDDPPVDKPPSSVPEPSSLIIWALAFGALLGTTRKRNVQIKR